MERNSGSGGGRRMGTESGGTGEGLVDSASTVFSSVSLEGEADEDCSGEDETRDNLPSWSICVLHSSVASCDFFGLKSRSALIFLLASPASAAAYPFAR